MSFYFYQYVHLNGTFSAIEPNFWTQGGHTAGSNPKRIKSQNESKPKMDPNPSFS